MKRYKQPLEGKVPQQKMPKESPNYPASLVKPKQVDVLAPKKKKVKKASPPPKTYTTITL